MAVTVVTAYTYPITDTLNDEVNTAILKQELDDATGLTVSVGNVNVSGSNVVIEMLGDAVAADETIVAGVVAAHEGDEFVETPLEESNNGTIATTDGSDTEVLSLETGPLPDGKYLVSWGVEYGMTLVSPVAEARIYFKTQKNSDAAVTRFQSAAYTNKWHHFGGSDMLTINNGNSYTLSLSIIADNTSNPAEARKRRIAIVKAD